MVQDQDNFGVFFNSVDLISCNFGMIFALVRQRDVYGKRTETFSEVANIGAGGL